jgi:hypothetical protein
MAVPGRVPGCTRRAARRATRRWTWSRGAERGARLRHTRVDRSCCFPMTMADDHHPEISQPRMPTITVPRTFAAHEFNRRMAEYLLAELEITTANAPPRDWCAKMVFPAMLHVADQMCISLPSRATILRIGFTPDELDQLALDAVHSGNYIEIFNLGAIEMVGAYTFI